MKRILTPTLGLFALLHPSSFILHPSRGADPVVDSPMYRDPQLPTPRPVPVFSERLLPMWLETLERPEKDLKCRAALSIAEARRRGMKGLEAAVPALVRELERPDQDRTVQASMARALVGLDARESAAALAQAAAAGDPDVRDLVEPALARWDYKPIRGEWLKRLDQPPYRRPAILAIQGLAAVREEKAAPRLRELALAAETPPAVRLEAARALGVIQPSGLEEDARKLAADTSARGKLDRLLAASLLRQHKSDEAVRQLQTLGRDAEPATAAAALARLVEIDPKLLLPLLEPTLANPDAKVRGFGVKVLHRLPSDTHIRLLGDRLSDPHPEVRTQARVALSDLDGKTEWRDVVRRDVMHVLNGEDWRGLEQAALLLGQVDYKPAASRLLVMLNGKRGEAIVAAAWALRKLAIPETLPDVFRYVEGQYDRMSEDDTTGGRSTLTPEAVDDQLAQLVQFLGKNKYRPADGLLRQFIPPGQPRNKVGYEARAAAAWALGLIHEGTEIPEIATMLARRVAADKPTDVEDTRVRWMSAITLGRMKAKSGLPTLREYYVEKRPSLFPFNNACGWAIEQITGEKVPEAGTVELMQLGWFLYPIP
jgi:HEAT repeat protein